MRPFAAVLALVAAGLVAGCHCGFGAVTDCGGQPCDAGQTAEGRIAVLPARLPVALHGASVAYDGRYVWVMGGMTPQRTMSAAVFRFDPADETLTEMGWKLPYGRQAAAAVPVGPDVYLFGGRRTESALIAEILKVTPGAGSTAVMAATLPTARYAVGAASVGSEVLLFGGFDYTHVAQILRFVPATGAITVDPTALSPGRDGPVTFAWGGAVYLLGGGSPVGTLKEVLRFSPASSQLEKLAVTLPATHWAGAPGIVGSRVYLYGGTVNATQPILTVSRVDLETLSAAEVPELVLAQPYYGAATASVGSRIYIFGGADPETGAIKDTIIRLTP